MINIPVGRCPSERITTASSAIEMEPSSSLSNSMNTSLNSTNIKMNDKNSLISGFQIKLYLYISSCGLFWAKKL